MICKRGDVLGFECEGDRAIGGAGNPSQKHILDPVKLAPIDREVGAVNRESSRGKAVGIPSKARTREDRVEDFELAPQKWVCDGEVAPLFANMADRDRGMYLGVLDTIWRWKAG